MRPGNAKSCSRCLTVCLRSNVCFIKCWTQLAISCFYVGRFFNFISTSVFHFFFYFYIKFNTIWKHFYFTYCQCDTSQCIHIHISSMFRCSTIALYRVHCASRSWTLVTNLAGIKISITIYFSCSITQKCNFKFIEALRTAVLSVIDLYMINVILCP